MIFFGHLIDRKIFFRKIDKKLHKLIKLTFYVIRMCHENNIVITIDGAKTLKNPITCFPTLSQRTIQLKFKSLSKCQNKSVLILKLKIL